MEESEDNMSSEDVLNVDSQSSVKKPKKRSLVERELETNMTARVTSPAVGEGLSKSRYGRARRLKTESELIEKQKELLACLKSPANDSTPVKVQSPVYRMHATNSPHKADTPKKSPNLDNQIDNIHQEKISLSRFSDEAGTPSPAKKFPKVYIRKDLIQNREEEETILLIKDLFSPTKSASKSLNQESTDNPVSTEKYKQNGHIDNSSVVKTLDFDSKKKKKDDKEPKAGLSKNELFEIEATCPYQVGDLAWARMGTFPFWPCIITRDPYSVMFVKKKLFGRVEHAVIHVTFLGDNGRRSWVVDNMLRSYLGHQEFLATRDQFTPEDKKKDSKLYAAFFVSEKKQALWNLSVEEAESLLREPKRLRIDIFNEMLWKNRAAKKTPKSGKISRTNSDVSLSESLYDSLFSEKEANADDTERSKNPKNKPFDVSEVVTACLDNMAAKTGITKIQRQSHMDRWLQKAKSKTPEKTQAKPTVARSEKKQKSSPPIKLNRKSGSKIITKPVSIPSVSHAKPYRFRKKSEPQSIETQSPSSQIMNNGKSCISKSDDANSSNCDLKVVTDNKGDLNQDNLMTAVIVENNPSYQPKNEPMVVITDSCENNLLESVIDKPVESDVNNSKIISNDGMNQANVEITDETLNTINIQKEKKTDTDEKKAVDFVSVNDTTVTSKPKKLRATSRLLQDSESCKIIKQIEEISSTSKNIEVPNLGSSNKHPTESLQERSDVIAEANRETLVSKVSCDLQMEVDNNTNDATTVLDSEKSNICEPSNNSVMEIDERPNIESQANEDTSLNSKTVSNMSVGSIDVVTDIKEAENVTIEVSVTEKKNDDTLNNLQREEDQESINKLKPQLSETKVDSMIFLDENLSRGFSKTNNAPKNSPLPEKKDTVIIDQEIRNIIPKKVVIQNEATPYNENKVMEENYDINKTINTKDIQNEATLHNEDKVMKENNDIHKTINNKDKHLESSLCVDDKINDKTTDHKTDILNESVDSESISHCTDDLQVTKDETMLEFQLNDSTESDQSITADQIDSIEEPVDNYMHVTGAVKEENENLSTRKYVESPTFTQLLESEEFFCDENEPYTKSENKNSARPELPTVIANKCKDGKKKIEAIEDFDDDEDTSEDEPSPEYESLDDEITEDFRKHMISIENNIKDKKNEEQIVKICNEIAEKAKLSPTKYTQDIQITKPDGKLDTNAKNVFITSLKVKLDLCLTENNTDYKEKTESRPLNEYNESSINKQVKSKVLKTNSAKELNQLNKKAKAFIKTNEVLENHKYNKQHIKEINVEINGDAVFHDLEKPKIIYRTRSSVSSASKERDSPDLKSESSLAKQYRKNCEYEPKVVIIRLERDKCSKGSSESKLTEETNKNNEQCQISLSGADHHHIQNTIMKIEEGNYKKRKSRLSLRRDHSKSKQTYSKNIQNSLSEIEVLKTENFKPEVSEKNEILTTAAKDSKKIEIEKISHEVSLPAPVTVNGYHHNLERKFTDTPDSIDDTDFDVETVSLNSEDSEVSIPNSIETIPKRNLRSRPERTLEFALQCPEFLKHLELQQDTLIDLYPEISEEEVLSYVYKTWQYQKDLEYDISKGDDTNTSSKQETPLRSHKAKTPKNIIENNFREKYEKSKKTINFESETGLTTNSVEIVAQNVELGVTESTDKSEIPTKQQKRSKSPECIEQIKGRCKETDAETLSVKSEDILTHISLRSKTTVIGLDVSVSVDDKNKPTPEEKQERDIDNESVGSEDSEIPLRQLRSRVLKESSSNEISKKAISENKFDEVPVIKEPPSNEVPAIEEPSPNNEVKAEVDDTALSNNEPLVKQKKKKTDKNVDDPGFIQYLALNQDSLIEQNPQLSQEEIIQYLYKSWLYDENLKSDIKKNDELEQKASLIEGLSPSIKLDNEVAPKKVKRKSKIEKQTDDIEVLPKEKPKRKIAQPFYRENYSDLEDELEVFEIFKAKKSTITIVSKAETGKAKSKVVSTKETSQTGEVKSDENETIIINDDDDSVEYIDDVEMYFAALTKPKPNVFKGLIREKICEICEYSDNLVKCKACYGMFHPDCVKKQMEPLEKDKEPMSLKGRKKKRKRKLKSLEDSENNSDEKSQDVSIDTSVEDIVPLEITFDVEYFESQIEAKMKEMLVETEFNYDSYSSDDGIDWTDSVPGKCEIVDVKLKRRDPPVDYSDFKCHNCQKHDVPVCFVCKSAVSKTDVAMRQKCHVAHCHKYYHLECLDHWPQTQFNSGESSRNNKKKNEFTESLTCPRHVCHTCVSDDPRGCKTRFSGDKLAKCVRCPATYHSFNKCLPAGSRVLTASHIICPRHSEQKAGKVPCHVNTGWCFICAAGGSLICCEYCPTSFHAECLNISPPEGNYMCEDCETGRLPLYGEMVWVKLGQYRWWPGMILHPSEIPDNIMAVKHELGEFVVRFFGQYDHYWVNRGRVFPYQEGDSGRISSQKSKLNDGFILAIEHAQRAYAILKNAKADEEESIDIASSLLPPHYVKLKCNKPSGSLCGKRPEDPSLSLTQCECNPDEPEPCGPYSQCLNRMLLTECGPTCRAGERCNNRAFEKRQYPRLVPYRTPHRGWGLKTLDDVRAGQFVIEYVGELIDEAEFRRRMRRKHEVRDENFYFLTLDKERMIDAGPKGNVARFMNHCCEPNCETQKWTVLGDVRVGLFAIDDIPANSEVTFNYNLECAGIEKKRCLCGAKRCSGYIGAKPKQDESQSKKGKDGKLKRAYNKKKKPNESPSTIKTKKKLGRPPKPKELTDLEKDLLIIKNATSLSSDEPKPDENTKRKGDPMPTDKVSICNGQIETKTSSKRKRVSLATDEVSICNGQEPSAKKQKCEKTSEVGD